MNAGGFDGLACPLDGDPLADSGASWRCPGGHSFDLARQGYIHLLPVQNKRSRDPGDSREMVAARRRFLNAGHYQPVADAVNAALLTGAAEGEAGLACLDAGCGEGYYLRQLAQAIGDTPLALVGLDISKWAVLAAAKQDTRPRWIVASNARLPVLPATLDRVLCLFGFPVYPEFARVLKPGGVLVQADAGANHLRELRELIYPSLRPPKQSSTGAPEGFSAADTRTVRYPLTLSNPETIADLLAMTPHLYRAPVQGRERAKALDALTVTVEVTLRCFTRLPGSVGIVN